MLRIIVDTQKEKDELLAQSEYIHYYMELGYLTRLVKKVAFGLDSDKANTLMHLYMNPDIIEVANIKTIDENLDEE